MAFKAIAGGLLSGLGTGLVAQAEQNRQAALERVRQMREDRHLVEGRDFQERRDKTLHDYDLELERTQSGLTMEREKAKAERERGVYATTKTDEKGRVYGITKGLGVKDLGITEAQKADKDGSGSGGGGGRGGLSSSDKSLLERVADKYWGKKNAEGQFILPEEARDKYTKMLARSGELVSAGVPATAAPEIAALSISGPLSEKEARKVAEREAREQFGGWTQGDEREKYIESRTPELMEQSRTALRDYQRLIGGGGGLLGAGGGTGAAPTQTQSQAQPSPAQQPQVQGAFVPPPVTPEPPAATNTAQLAQSAVNKARQGIALSPQERQAVIEQANEAVAAGKDPQAVLQRLEQMGIKTTLQGAR